ncbi:alpha/beta hydrolase [Parablautia intestinalis]|jgi:acetyl esterase/lipase|uniref:Alpha/beta hydrolase n=1 Tax=Parablautia intestinalis TaxID=2320100 RepID=A0A3A9B5H8_9FIRM|nr:alpha/beta hydrolase [Parablautia intestinalis]MCI8615510.1 alpha/beta hydrolase [Lachnospiraceae bacterium]RKI94055.1 alpha/beta hydrolase [Parablautia intestinalis]
MEVKEWTYEELPEFTQEVEGAQVIATTGDEMCAVYIPNVEYAQIDGVKLHLQILIPSTRNQPEMICPCVVFVQGSAWMPQDVYAQIPRVSRLAERGYVVAVVEYRHSGIAPFPAQIMDARNAIRFLRVNAQQYHIDPEQIIVSGDSSGGHTAMFAGMIHDDVENNLFPGVSAEVKGIVNYYGSTSVMAEDSNPTQLLHCQADSPEGMVMGHVDLRNNMELKRKLSVECNITEDSVIPPTIILHGTKDCVVNCEGSAILYRQMKKCGKNVKLYLIKGANHGGPEFWTKEVLDIVDGFMKDCLHV